MTVTAPLYYTHLPQRFCGSAIASDCSCLLCTTQQGSVFEILNNYNETLQISYLTFYVDVYSPCIAPPCALPVSPENVGLVSLWCASPSDYLCFVYPCADWPSGLVFRPLRLFPPLAGGQPQGRARLRSILAEAPQFAPRAFPWGTGLFQSQTQPRCARLGAASQPPNPPPSMTAAIGFAPIADVGGEFDLVHPIHVTSPSEHTCQLLCLRLRRPSHLALRCEPDEHRL